MIPLHVALPGITLGAVLGWLVDRARREQRPWAARVLIGLAIMLALYLHPVAAVGLVALVALCPRGAASPGGPRMPRHCSTKWRGRPG